MAKKCCKNCEYHSESNEIHFCTVGYEPVPMKEYYGHENIEELVCKEFEQLHHDEY
jgi:hypothetical protein